MAVPSVHAAGRGASRRRRVCARLEGVGVGRQPHDRHCVRLSTPYSTPLCTHSLTHRCRPSRAANAARLDPLGVGPRIGRMRGEASWRTGGWGLSRAAGLGARRHAEPSCLTGRSRSSAKRRRKKSARRAPSRPSCPARCRPKSTGWLRHSLRPALPRLPAYPCPRGSPLCSLPLPPRPPPAPSARPSRSIRRPTALSRAAPPPVQSTRAHGRAAGPVFAGRAGSSSSAARRRPRRGTFSRSATASCRRPWRRSSRHKSLRRCVPWRAM